MIYKGGPHMRSLISIHFLVLKVEPESAYVVSTVSVHCLHVAIAMQNHAGNIRQHSPILCYSALPRYSAPYFHSNTQCN